MTRVLVTQKEYHKGEHIFEAAQGLDIHPAPADETSLADEVRRQSAAAVVVGVEPYTGALYEALSETAGSKRNALIARFGVGYDGIDLTQANEHGVLVTNTPGVLDQSVAEHTIWLLGALARHITDGNLAMRNGIFPASTGMELSGKTLGVLGFGPIGQRVARIAHLGLGMQVIAFDRLPLPALATRTGTELQTIGALTGVTDIEHDPNAVIERSHAVSLHLPLTPSTRGFIDANRLRRFRTGSLLINTARGPLVDEVALYDALSLSNGPCGAALDVFETEPYVPQHPEKDLRTLRNVVLTPHIGSSTIEANKRMANACLQNVSAFAEGRIEDMTCVQGCTAA